jgi:tight adherence protein B
MSLTLMNSLLLGVVILLASGFIIWGLHSAITPNDEMHDRLHAYANVGEQNQFEGNARSRLGITRFRLRLNSLLSVFVSRKLSVQLMSAHWPITEIEFSLIRILGAFVGFFIGSILLQSALSGLGLAILIYLIPGIYLRFSINKRRTRFNQQLVDALLLVEGGIRAGYSLLQSLDLIIEELPAPASDEFQRVKQEVGLGLPLGEALVNLTNRMHNKDLNLVVSAININSQVGGNLTTMISVVTQTIRERNQLFSEIRVLTSQQRYTGYLLTLLPFLVGAVLFVLNADYMSRIFEPELLCVPVGALISIFLGNLVIRRMVRIDI